MFGYRQKQCIVIIMASILRRRVGARLPSPGLDPKSAILIEQTERLSVGRELLSTTLIIQVIPDQQRTVSCRNQGRLPIYRHIHMVWHSGSCCGNRRTALNPQGSGG